MTGHEDGSGLRQGTILTFPWPREKGTIKLQPEKLSPLRRKVMVKVDVSTPEVTEC
jgi:hypothetical protein